MFRDLAGEELYPYSCEWNAFPVNPLHGRPKPTIFGWAVGCWESSYFCLLVSLAPHKNFLRHFRPRAPYKCSGRRSVSSGKVKARGSARHASRLKTTDFRWHPSTGVKVKREFDVSQETTVAKVDWFHTCFNHKCGPDEVSVAIPDHTIELWCCAWAACWPILSCRLNNGMAYTICWSHMRESCTVQSGMIPREGDCSLQNSPRSSILPQLSNLKSPRVHLALGIVPCRLFTRCVFSLSFLHKVLATLHCSPWGEGRGSGHPRGYCS